MLSLAAALLLCGSGIQALDPEAQGLTEDSQVQEYLGTEARRLVRHYSDDLALRHLVQCDMCTLMANNLKGAMTHYLSRLSKRPSEWDIDAKMQQVCDQVAESVGIRMLVGPAQDRQLRGAADRVEFGTKPDLLFQSAWTENLLLNACAPLTELPDVFTHNPDMGKSELWQRACVDTNHCHGTEMLDTLSEEEQLYLKAKVKALVVQMAYEVQEDPFVSYELECLSCVHASRHLDLEIERIWNERGPGFFVDMDIPHSEVRAELQNLCLPLRRFSMDYRYWEDEMRMAWKPTSADSLLFASAGQLTLPLAGNCGTLALKHMEHFDPLERAMSSERKIHSNNWNGTGVRTDEAYLKYCRTGPKLCSNRPVKSRRWHGSDPNIQHLIKAVLQDFKKAKQDATLGAGDDEEEDNKYAHLFDEVDLELDEDVRQPGWESANDSHQHDEL